jgi:hypothetical protein
MPGMDGSPAGMGGMSYGNNDKIDTLIDFPIKGLKLNKFVKNKELPHETIVTQENVPFYMGGLTSKQIITPANK